LVNRSNQTYDSRQGPLQGAFHSLPPDAALQMEKQSKAIEGVTLVQTNTQCATLVIRYTKP
jgi:hypothetical protein